MSASSIKSPVVSDTTDLTKLSAEELLGVVATLQQQNKTLLEAGNKAGLTSKRISKDANYPIARIEEGQLPPLSRVDCLSVPKDIPTDRNISLIEPESVDISVAVQMARKNTLNVIYIDPKGGYYLN